MSEGLILSAGGDGIITPDDIEIVDPMSMIGGILNGLQEIYEAHEELAEKILHLENRIEQLENTNSDISP